jgi:hypothetical protein
MSRGLTIARHIICLNHQNITKMCRTAWSQIIQIDLIQSMLGDGQICMEVPESEVLHIENSSATNKDSSN